jgi:hypothetical protein
MYYHFTCVGLDCSLLLLDMLFTPLFSAAGCSASARAGLLWEWYKLFSTDCNTWLGRCTVCSGGPGRQGQLKGSVRAGKWCLSVPAPVMYHISSSNVAWKSAGEGVLFEVC